jgi:phosphate transport system permease protein
MREKKRIERRLREEKIIKAIMRFCALLLVVLLLGIILTVAIKGFPALSLSMLINTPKGGFYLGGEGGILNAILGSLFVASGATLLAFAISIPIVLYINVYRNRKSLLAELIRFTFDVLWGVPSIVYGAFGFTLMIFIGLKASLLAGIIVIALVEIPILARAVDEVVQVIPTDLKAAALSLGATNGETAWKVIIRQVFPGIITALLLALGRGIGDAAAVLFTAGFSDYIPQSLTQPVATLPLAIFFQFSSPDPEVQKRAYAAAFILTMLVLFISIAARYFSKKLSRYKVDHS